MAISGLAVPLGFACAMMALVTLLPAKLVRAFVLLPTTVLMIVPMMMPVVYRHHLLQPAQLQPLNQQMRQIVTWCVKTVKMEMLDLVAPPIIVCAMMALVIKIPARMDMDSA